MRTYKYKIQNHKRNRHLQKDLSIIAHVHNHFVALWQRHYRIYGQCEGYKRPSCYRMIKHLTKLKRLAKYQHWTLPYSWCLQECILRIDRGWQNFFEGRAKRPPKFRSRFDILPLLKRGGFISPMPQGRSWDQRPLLSKKVLQSLLRTVDAPTAPHEEVLRTMSTRDLNGMSYYASFPERAIDVTKNFSSIETQGFYVIVSLPSGLPPHQSQPIPIATNILTDLACSVKKIS